MRSTHADDERGEHDPAHLPPYAGPVANHLFDVVVELVHTCETNESMMKIFISNLFQFAAGLPCVTTRTLNTGVLVTLRLNHRLKPYIPPSGCDDFSHM